VTAVRNRDLWIALFTVALAAGYLLAAGRIRVGSFGVTAIGPRTYPQVLGWVLLGTGVAMGVTALLARRAGRTDDTDEATDEAADTPENGEPAPTSRRVALVALVTLTIGYLAVLGPLGFLLATAPYVAAAMVVFDGFEHYRGRRLAIPLVTGVVLSVAMHALFDGALGVVLPPGLFDPAWGF
jgi:hypothetical protein